MPVFATSSTSDEPVKRRKKEGKKKGGLYDAHAVEAVATSTDVTVDGRRFKARRKKLARTQDTPESTQPPFEPQEDLNTAAMADSLEFSYLLGQGVDPDLAATPEDGINVIKTPRNLNSDNPMLSWRPFREEYLRELVQLDGHCEAECQHCTRMERTDAGLARYRCRDAECFSLGNVCASCVVDVHKMLPFHWVEKWNGTFYESCTLQRLGLCIQLGHKNVDICPAPVITTSSFTIIHYNGVHDVSLSFCGCSNAPEFRCQLLRASLWPSTPLQPRTAMTFPLLHLFHNLNTLGKLPAYDLWKALETMTTNETGVNPQDCYKIILRTIRQWRYIKMLKRAGRIHDPSGIAGTADGELAVECPACPHPGKNLVAGWEQRPKQFLNNIFLASDANFRARNSLVSSLERDPPLMDGKSYFIPHGPYKTHLANFVNEDDLSSCSGFKAMFLANLKNVKGLRTTGVAGVTCSRHGLWRANGIGPLQRGERFCNMDPIISVSLKDAGTLKVIFSYDIVCQYCPHFWERIKALPSDIQVEIAPERVTFLIPKFHWWNHEPLDHAQYSFNFVPGVGRTSGEIIEENWSDSNRAASQTKMMGPGAWEDTLSDIFGFHNWRTTMSLGRVLKSRLVEAIKEARVHSTDFKNFDEGLEHYLGRAMLEGWKAEVIAWERDHSCPCPYESQLQRRETMADVELALAKQEHEAFMRGGGVVQESSMSKFLKLGLDIEGNQRALAWEVKARQQGTTYQELNIQKQRTAIAKMIMKFRGLQQIFMPNLREYLTPEQLSHIDNAANVLAEATKLFLPSELLAAHRALPRACPPTLVEFETRLRWVECRESLENLRNGLRTRSIAHRFTVRNITGQNPVTRAEGIQRQVQISIQLNKLRYRWARNALLRLKGHGEWERELQVLNDGDVRGLTERMLGEEEQAEQNILQQHGLINESISTAASSSSHRDHDGSVGEGRRRLSWIWYAYPDPLTDELEVVAHNSEPIIQESLKIEWVKARARKLRWEEEVDLLVEEMERVPRFFRWKATWWRSRSPGTSDNDEAKLISGFSAYAALQASRLEMKANEFERQWADLLVIGKELIQGMPPSRSINIELDDDTTNMYDDDAEAGSAE